MSDKAAKKKQFILDTAKGVFSQKGYNTVTMKDIVDACEISRGGLYIYFDNTEQILLECLEKDSALFGGLSSHPAGEALAMFLNEKKKEILMSENNLTAAVYEFLFSKYLSKSEDNPAKSEFLKTLYVLTEIIEKGVSDEEFYAEDIELTARNILYCIEGLKVASQTMGITEKEVDDELLYLLSGLILEE